MRTVQRFATWTMASLGPRGRVDRQDLHGMAKVYLRALSGIAAGDVLGPREGRCRYLDRLGRQSRWKRTSRRFSPNTKPKVGGFGIHRSEKIVRTPSISPALVKQIVRKPRTSPRMLLTAGRSHSPRGPHAHSLMVEAWCRRVLGPDCAHRRRRF